ncbi:MAG: extracellular solute-binding protein [Peptococcaceae bacterium]|jgi:multiple sugar transport system substrate-binding protein|nr:extracellular solute-binding protein [Peptococcaceae bacterium]
MNQGGALKALEFMRKTVDLGLVDPNSLTADEPTAMNAFISGNAAFNTNWTFVYGNMNNPKDSKIVGEGQVTTFPVASGTNQASASVSGFQGLAIMANSKHPNAAWKWIQFATSNAIQAQHLDEMPIWTSLQKSPAALKANPAISVYTVNLDNVYNRPLVPDYMQVSTIIQKYVHAVLAQEMSPQAGADAMVKDIKALNNSR